MQKEVWDQELYETGKQSHLQALTGLPKELTEDH